MKKKTLSAESRIMSKRGKKRWESVSAAERTRIMSALQKKRKYTKKI